ncbi:MAG: TRAP transporter large permease [Candidatus Methylomirabilales bacterium]
MSPGDIALILFGTFAGLIILRVPVAFALGLAVLPVMMFEPRLTPVLMMGEMTKAYNAFILLAVPFFLLSANIMNSAGITDRLVDLTKCLVGQFRGGLAYINVVVSMIFAGISGSSTADAAGEGSLIIPAMKKQGYDTPFTVAITACSSVIGVIIPPSVLMVVWGGVLNTSIGAMFLGGFIPGAMVGLSQMAAVYVYAKRRNYPVYARATVREFFLSLWRALAAIMTPVIIIGGVVGGFVTPTEAAVVAVLYSFCVGMMIHRSVGVREIKDVLYNTTRLASISLFCIGTASAFGWVMAYYQLPRLVVSELSKLGVGVTSVGLVVAGAFLFIGCFIDAVPAIIIIAPLLAPLAQSVGMHPVHFGIIGVISLAFGLVTPPYGLCLLIDCHIAGVKVSDVLKDVLIILVPMLTALLLVILFPQTVLFIPKLIMPKFV